MGNNDNLYAAIAVIAILSFAVTMIVGAVAYREAFNMASPSNIQKSTITVSATGSASAMPQQAVVYLTANGTARSAANATSMLSKTVYAISSTLAGYLSNGSMIQTTSYQLYAPYNSPYYTASEGMQFTVPVGLVGNAIGDLASLHNVFINSVSIQLSQAQVSNLSSTALSIAMQNATAQAQEVAGPHVPLTISSVTLNTGPYVFPGSRYFVAAESVPVFPGTQSVTQSITVVFTHQ